MVDGWVLVFSALAPLASMLLLIAGFHWPAFRAMPVSWFLAVLVGAGVWGMSPLLLAAASMKGILVAVDILFIIVGAIALLKVLEIGGAINAIDRLLSRVSSDRRIQAVLIAWMLGNFIEGAAGFGTPQAIAAPLLVSLGFPALAAVLISTLGNSAPVTFGAVGTPILLGFGSVLEEGAALIPQVTVASAFLHAVIGSFVPVMMVCLLTRYFGGRRSWREGFEVWPFALWAGVCFTVPYMLIAWVLGPELPTLVGAIIGMPVLLCSTKRGFLIPRRRWDFPPRSEWPASWLSAHHSMHKERKVGAWKAVFPYMTVGVLLLLTRINSVGLGILLKKVKLTIPLGSESQVIYPLYSPGFLFLLVAAGSLVVFGLSRKDAAEAVASALSKVKFAFIALSFAIAMVQILLWSDRNLAGLPGMPQVIGGLLDGLGHGYVFFAPLLGLLGGFIAGSNTVSNILFGHIQLDAAMRIGVSPVAVLALQTVGGAVGNIIAFFNIIAASAVVGLHGQEGRIMRMNLGPALLYCLLAGILAWVFLV